MQAEVVAEEAATSGQTQAVPVGQTQAVPVGQTQTPLQAPPQPLGQSGVAAGSPVEQAVGVDSGLAQGGGERVSGVEHDSSMGGLDSTVPLEKKNRKMFAVGMIVLVVMLSGLGVVLYQRSKLPPISQESQVVEVQTGEGAEASPTPEPTPTAMTREEITVEVLNGSGVTGAAGALAKKLEELGYKIGEVGNAPEAAGHELYVRTDLEKELAVLLADLETELGIATISGYLEDSEANARVVLGLGKPATGEKEATESARGE